MENIAPLYAHLLPANPGKLLATVPTAQPDTLLHLHQSCLLQTTAKKQQIIPFDFDLKYSFTLAPPSLDFQKQQERVHFALRSEGDLEICRQILRGKLNQRGFHEQFKPKKKIGKGNFASVYLAQKLELGRSMAIKAFSKEAAYSEDKGKECLIKEIQIMRVLNQKNCMKLHEVFESQNSLYIAVELLQGGQLYDKIKAKYKFKSRQTKAVMHSILLGLSEMHGRRIMHRDLKPENILFRREGSWECVIADFGLAEFADAEEYLFVRCGTPGYVAPEVINIKDMKTKYDPICDVFSLGLIFHIFLLGVSAFPGKTYNQVLAQNRAANITFEGEEYKRLDADALDLLTRMLKKNPLERITAVEALAHPYFESFEQEQELQDCVAEIVSTPKMHAKELGKCESPMINSPNSQLARKQLKKDSCLELKMGRENVFTGKVDTIAQTNSTANSVGKRFQSVVMPKVSKFSTKK